MKKHTGNYTAEASKILKKADQLHCTRIPESEDIYLCTGYILLRMNPAEYAAVAQSATCCDAGDWHKSSAGKQDGSSLNAGKIFADGVKATHNVAALDRCPLEATAKGGRIAWYYNADKGYACCYNAQFVDALAPGYTLRAASPTAPAVAYRDGEPFALLMPVKPDPNAARAVAAFFNPQPTNGDAAQLQQDLAAAQRHNDELQAALAACTNEADNLRQELTQARAELAAQQTQQPAADPDPEHKPTADTIAQRFTAFPGVTATIKGAQTASPVIWLSGNVEPHADALKAAGAKWSGKKSAYYVRVA